MKVTVVVYGWLVSALGRPTVELQLADGATVKQALLSLGVDEVEYASAILNSQQALEDEVLSDGDVLYAFPPIAGG